MNRDQHKKREAAVLGEYYNPTVDLILDDPGELKRFTGRHRRGSHTFEEIAAIKLLYGEIGQIQALMHIWLDYKL